MKLLFQLQCLFLLFCLYKTKLIAPRKIIYAVDCGGTVDLRSSIGVKFLKDQNYSQEVQTHTVDYYQDMELLKPLVKYTVDTNIYLTERHSDQTFEYFIPITRNGSITNTHYVLILKFAELYFNQSSQRVFSIGLGDQIIKNSLDIYDLVGFKTAYDEYIEILFKNNAIYWNNIKCQNALTKDNEVIVRFIKTQYDNPMVNAIMMFEGELNETDFYDREQYIQEWHKRYPNETRFDRKKKRQQVYVNQQISRDQKINKIKIRPGYENEILIDAEDIQPNQDNILNNLGYLEILKFMLTTPIGILCALGFLFSSFIIFVYTFFDPNNQKANYKKYQQILEDQLRKSDTQESSTSSVSERNINTDFDSKVQRNFQPLDKINKSIKVGLIESPKKKKQ